MLTDSELVCLAVAQSLLGFTSATHWLRRAQPTAGSGSARTSRSSVSRLPGNPSWAARRAPARPVSATAILVSIAVS